MDTSKVDALAHDRIEGLLRAFDNLDHRVERLEILLISVEGLIRDHFRPQGRKTQK